MSQDNLSYTIGLLIAIVVAILLELKPWQAGLNGGFWVLFIWIIIKLFNR